MKLYPLDFYDGHAQCRSCLNAKTAATRRKRSEEVNAYHRKWRKKHKQKRRQTYVKSRFGISNDQVEKILQAQGGGCAICGRKPANKALDIDHDHKTGAVRGLLCNKHNQAIGLFEDNPDLLERAATYLREPPARRAASGLTS